MVGWREAGGMGKKNFRSEKKDPWATPHELEGKKTALIGD